MSRTDELRHLVSCLGISQREAAKKLEVDERTFRYWCVGKPEPPLIAIYALSYLKEKDEWRDPERWAED